MERRRLDRAEWWLLALFGAVSLWVLALDLWQVVAHGRDWTGTDGSFAVDQMQYLAWIQSASHHLLVANMFVLHGTPADYFQPAIAVSGALTALGVPATVALLLWKPVAVVGLFVAIRAYALRQLSEPTAGRRAVVLALALFFGSFTVFYGQVNVIGDLFPGFLSWGYPFSLIALTASMFALLRYAAAREAGAFSWAPALLGLLAGLLHPWQAEVELVVLAGAEAWCLVLAARSPAGWRSWMPRRRAALLAVTVAGALAPLVYYAALGHLDPSWQLARAASRHSFPLGAVLLALAPLLAVAALGYRQPARGFLDRVTRTWPLAALAVYVLSSSVLGATPLHAFDGVTIPLALLAVQGCAPLADWRRRRSRLVLAGLLLLVTVPATVKELSTARYYAAPTPGNPNFLARDEDRALAFLRADRDPGGVLTTYYLGTAIPAKTGRQTYVGDCIWSEPDCQGRADDAQALFGGRMQAGQARAFVAAVSPRFLVSSCNERADLTGELGTLLVGVHRFGCATVYEVDTTPAPAP